MPLGGNRAPSSGLGNNNQGTGGRELVVCLVISVVLFTVGVRTGEDGPLGAVRGAFQTVTTPVRLVGSAITMPFQGLGNIFSNLTADQATLSELQAENDELRSRNAELEEAEQTATRLQGLLDLQSSYNLQSTAAHIISGSSDSWSSTVTIDKGTSSGLSVGMPVTSSSGVIGQIVECGATSSTVLLVTDESSSVSAMVQSSRAQGMLDGSAAGEVRLDMIRTDQTVEVGDIVVTSGLGGVFPKGLPLGKVTSVEKNPGSMYYTIVVEPYAHTENAEEVLVITSLTDSQVATSEDVASADSQETSASSSSASEDSNSDADSSGSGSSSSGSSSSSASTTSSGN
ncbi:MAG: rod shape-determining protein MreC [Olsenella sp.]|nr:rod shape-determining protein MreC [Olsenella sp.]